MNKNKIILKSTFIIICLIFICFFFSNKTIEDYYLTFTASSFLYLIFIFYLIKVDVNQREFYTAIVILILIKILFLFISPIGSLDFYRYLWDGKTIVNGINPYLYAPNADELKFLHTETLPSLISFPEIKTIYFPVSQLLFFISFLIGGESIIGLKLIIFIADILMFYFLLKYLNKNKINKKYLFIYFISPLIYYQILIDIHIDIFVVLFFIVLLLYKDDKSFFSKILYGLSLSVKPTALITLPIFIFSSKDKNEKLFWLIIPLFVLIVSFIPFLFDVNPFEALILFSQKWIFNGFFYNLLSLIFNDGLIIRLILFPSLIICLILLIKSKLSFFEKLYYALLFLFLFSPIVHQWYIVILVPMMVIIPRWSGILYTTLISLSFYTVMNYQLTGIWKDNLWILFAEYIPVLIVLYLELIGKIKPIRKSI